MRQFLLSIIISVVCTLPCAAWKFEYIDGAELKSCAATKNYNNAFFTVRLYEESIDIVLHHNDFSLPLQQTLGVIKLEFDDKIIFGISTSADTVTRHGSSTTSVIYVSFHEDEYALLFDALRNSKSLKIIYPSNDIYSVDLSGSARALNQASSCWSKAKTGAAGKNPFVPEQQINPFIKTMPNTPSNSTPNGEKKEIDVSI